MRGRRLAVIGVAAAAFAGSSVGIDATVPPAVASGAVAPTTVAPTTVASTVRVSTTVAPTVKPLDWKSCRDVREIRCASLQVPLDRTRPAGPKVSIAISMLPARSRNRRIGVLLVNPGGPGSSGQKFVRQLRRGFSATILDRFDVIGWDPRGVGGSGEIRCYSDQKSYDRYYAVDPDPDSPAEVAALIDTARQFAQACGAKNPRDVLRFAGTADVIDDMDAIRVALGEETISFFGFSYGTLLGLRYADKYPKRVRAFALDGILDPTADTSERSEEQAAGFDRALAGFLDLCGDVRCGWVRKGETAGDAFDRLAKTLDAKPISVRRGSGPARLVGPGEFIVGVLASLYNRDSGWPLLRRALSEVEKGDASTMLALFYSYADREPTGYGNIAEANAAVNCVDVPSPRGGAPYAALAERLGTTSPRFGRLAGYSSIVCGFWPVPSTGSVAPVAAKGSAPILLVGTTRDPATPYVWARSVERQLDNSVLLTYDSDGHTGYLGGNPCVRRNVHRYLVDLVLPPTGTACERTR